jgi:hypothetical protein
MSLDLEKQATDNLAEKIAHDMRMGEYGEDLWEEIARMLDSFDVRDRDAVEDMSLSDIIKVAARKRAESKVCDDARYEEMQRIEQDRRDAAADHAWEQAKEARLESIHR